ncbi:MAG: DUF4313 domain-containing protein [Clostridia bacterium]|nr:DUF4313 domain-containing protein [Clostridia bacterium]
MEKVQRKTLKFKNKNLIIKIGQYFYNGNLALTVYTQAGEPYSNITINLPGMLLDNNEGFIDSLAKSCGLEKELQKAGIIEEIYGSRKYNFGTYDMVLFNMEKLKEYDPEGFEKYQYDEETEEMEE